MSLVMYMSLHQLAWALYYSCLLPCWQTTYHRIDAIHNTGFNALGIRLLIDSYLESERLINLEYSLEYLKCK